MDNDEFDLVRWDVPFADAHYPNVTLLPDPGGLVRVVVAVGGINRYLAIEEPTISVLSGPTILQTTYQA